MTHLKFRGVGRFTRIVNVQEELECLLEDIAQFLLNGYKSIRFSHYSVYCDGQ